MIPFGELAPDVADLNSKVSRSAINVLPGANSYLPMKSLAANSNALDNACQGATIAKDAENITYIYAGDRTKLYNIDGVTVTNYSKAGNYASNFESWSFVKWGNKLIASKFGNIPQVLTLGGTTFADLGGSPPEAKTITTVRDFVVTGNTKDSSDGHVNNRVWWSGFNNEANWTPGTNQSDIQDLQGHGGAIQKIIGGEYGIVFQQRSITRMTYVGTPLVFQFDEIEPNLGTPAENSVVQHGSDIFYLGQDGFYVLTNGTKSEPIGVNKVDNYFWNDVNQSFLNRITGAISRENSVVVWAYPSNSSNGDPDKLIMFNFKTGKWSTAITDLQMIFSGARNAFTIEDLDVFGTIDSLLVSLDSDVWKGGAMQLSAFDTDNKLAFFSGATLPATLETGEISTDSYLTSLKSVRPVIDGLCTVTIATRDSLLDSPSVALPVTLDSTQKANIRTHARYHRIKIITSGDFTHAQGVEPSIKSRGKR